jgi:hypothetical protein
MIPLSSSNLAGYDYNPETRSLTISFLHGRSYTFRDVPEDVAHGLATAESAGKYFNSEIKNTYAQG